MAREPRPAAPWATLCAATAGIGSLGFVGLWFLGPFAPWAGLRDNVATIALIWLLCIAALVLVFLVWAVQDRRAKHIREVAEASQLATERAASEALKATGVCSQCGRRAPKWFLEKLPRMGKGYRLCYHCSALAPYPMDGETKETFTQRWTDARQKEAAELVQCVVCLRDVTRGSTSFVMVNFSTTPNRVTMKQSSVCFDCMEHTKGQVVAGARAVRDGSDA